MRHALRVAVLVAVLLLALLAGGAASASGKDEERRGEDDEPIPALEPVCSSGSNDDVGPVRQIKFGDTVALDDLGPIIVNDDCTMRRIENWPRMTDRERRGTQKRVSRETPRGWRSAGTITRRRASGTTRTRTRSISGRDHRAGGIPRTNEWTSPDPKRSSRSSIR